MHSRKEGIAVSEQCVLTFHRVVQSCEVSHDVSWSSFNRILDAIQHPIEPDLRLAPSRSRRVVLTFDDGTTDHAAVADALELRGMRGIFFVPASTLGEGGRLTAGDCVTLVAQRHVIGSHGYSDKRIDGLSATELRTELIASKQTLEDIVGMEVIYFSPSGGSDHPLMAQQLAQSGYARARSMRWGIDHSGHDVWRIPCIPVTEATVERGWVEHALVEWQLPLDMRLAWVGKEALPLWARSAMRDRLHRKYQ